MNGRVDMVITHEQQTFIFEFKVVEQVGTGQALRQIIDRGYAEKYRQPRMKVWGVGVEFSKAQRKLVAFEMKELLAPGG